MRITKDYDIILSLGALTKPFILKLREFIIKAGYNTIACGSSSKNLFRFSGPRNDDFPEQIELLVPLTDMVDEIFSLEEITYIKVEDEYTSLSAILLDEEYFKFINISSRKLHLNL